MIIIFISLLLLIIGYLLYIQFKTIRDVNILLSGLIQDGSVIYVFQNIHAKRIQDIEQKLGIESIHPEVYKKVKEMVLSNLINRGK